MRLSSIQALLAAVVVGAIGVIGLIVRQPLLAPSLASALFVQVMTPRQQSAKPWPVFGGQIIGLVGAVVAVYAVGAAGLPTLDSGHPLLPARIAAATLAIFLTVLLQRATQSSSPAGGATAVLVALGTEHADFAGCLRVFAAIVLVTGLGEAARYLMLRYAGETA